MNLQIAFLCFLLFITIEIPSYKANDTTSILNPWKIYCPEENFNYSYILSDGHLELATSTWPRTRAGRFATLEDICLRPNGKPVIRRCLSGKRTEWEPISNVQCWKDARQLIITKHLKQIDSFTNQNNTYNVNTANITRDLVSTLMKPYLKLIPADVFYASRIMKKITESDENAEVADNFLDICQSLMCANQTILRISADLNATNDLLQSFEDYLDRLSSKIASSSQCNPGHSGNSNQKANLHSILSSFGATGLFRENISVFFVNPNCANITGIAVYSEPAGSSFESALRSDSRLLYDSKAKLMFRFIFMDESIDEVMLERNLETAVFLPSSVWQHIDEEFKATRMRPQLVFKIYSNDALFVETMHQYNYRPSSKVISISVPHHYGHFPKPLYFIVRNHNVNTKIGGQKSDASSGCGYWNYETWVRADVKTEIENAEQETLIKCSTTHLTQFSFLLAGNYRQNDLNDAILLSPLHQRILDIITLIGCSLSLAGLLGIWLTAALFSTWRSQASTKVLLNMCVALTLQMILFVFVNTDQNSKELIEKGSYTKCIVLGALLQYSILVLFTWTLIIAFLQFQRYVTIVGIKRPSHYILKSAIAAWTFPLIPTLCVALIDPKSYIPTETELREDTGICYPSGPGLTFGVILPVTLVCIINTVIFIYVFYSISQTLSQSTQRHEKRLVVRQIRLSILLYFLLGLSWIFGILSFLKAGTIFSYLFCITATLQGFVMFIYFVILDEIARSAWANLLCRRKTVKSKFEDQSMTHSSRYDNDH